MIQFCTEINSKVNHLCFYADFQQEGKAVIDVTDYTLKGITHNLRLKLSSRGYNEDQEFANIATIYNNICYSDKVKCDYQAQCLSGIDEDPNQCSQKVEGINQYHYRQFSELHCPLKSQRNCLSSFSQCVDKSKFCDGHYDCADRSDEMFCESCYYNKNKFLPEQVCDGVNDCYEGVAVVNQTEYQSRDEMFCESSFESARKREKDTCATDLECGLGVACEDNICQEKCKNPNQFLKFKPHSSSASNFPGKCVLNIPKPETNSNATETTTDYDFEVMIHESDIVYKVGFVSQAPIHKKLQLIDQINSDSPNAFNYSRILNFSLDPYNKNFYYQIINEDHRKISDMLIEKRRRLEKKVKFDFEFDALKTLNSEKDVTIRSSGGATNYLFNVWNVDTRTGQLYCHATLRLENNVPYEYDFIHIVKIKGNN